jgi:kynureninase
MSGAGGDIALGHNTHELLTRLLSALPLRDRPRLVTTDAEFHSVRRQLDRLAEEGLEIVKVPGRPAETAAERMAAAVDERTACALISSVFYETAEIVPHLDAVARACRRTGTAFVVELAMRQSRSAQLGIQFTRDRRANPECRNKPSVTGQ